jgi:hypothetical protein
VSQPPRAMNLLLVRIRSLVAAAGAAVGMARVVRDSSGRAAVEKTTGWFGVDHREAETRFDDPWAGNRTAEPEIPRWKTQRAWEAGNDDSSTSGEWKTGADEVRRRV